MAGQGGGAIIGAIAGAFFSSGSGEGRSRSRGGKKFSGLDVKRVYFGSETYPLDYGQDFLSLSSMYIIHISGSLSTDWLRDLSQVCDIAGFKAMTGESLVICIMTMGFLTFGKSITLSLGFRHPYLLHVVFCTDHRLRYARISSYTRKIVGVFADRAHWCKLPPVLPQRVVVQHVSWSRLGVMCNQNPKGYGEGEDPQSYDPRLRPRVDEERELEIDQRNGMKVSPSCWESRTPDLTFHTINPTRNISRRTMNLSIPQPNASEEPSGNVFRSVGKLAPRTMKKKNTKASDC